MQRRHAELSPILKKQVTAAVAVDPRIIVEDKGSSLAVHYRLAPEPGPLHQEQDRRHSRSRARGEARNAVRQGCDRNQAAELQQRHCRVRAACKCPPFAQRTPLFVGDDVTDESVFAVLPALGGLGYSVGREVAGVEGIFDGPQDVRDWLTDLCSRDGMKSG